MSDKKTVFDYASNSKIKKIYLELPDGYRYRHHSFGEGVEDDGEFLGRDSILRSFVDTLKSGSDKGVYLVTGYRGMGKTSFVKKVTRKLRKECEVEKLKVPEVIELSLAQSQLRDIDVLKLIVGKIKGHLETTDEYRNFKRIELSNMFAWLWPVITAIIMAVFLIPAQNTVKSVLENLIGITTLSAAISLFIHRFSSWYLHRLAKYPLFTPRILVLLYVVIYIAVLLQPSVLKFVSDWLSYLFQVSTLRSEELKTYGSLWEEYIKLFFAVVFYSFVIYLLLKFITAYRRENDSITEKKSLIDIYERCRNLDDRCHSQVTKEDQSQESFATSLSSLFSKNQRTFPIANPREIENELIGILDDLAPHFKYIFVFDELDKVDPRLEEIDPSSARDKGINGQPNINSIDTRDRRHMVINILASLKYFVNEAEAKFIFIAGREMFEAALADISDRQSAIGSIFHKVIYVDSFLKDKTGHKRHISEIGGLVEDFVRNFLLGSRIYTGDEKIEENFFAQYYKYLIQPENFKSHSAHFNPEKLSGDEAMAVIFTVHNFVNYLIYRSNGSPKKMAKLFEEYVVKIDGPTDPSSNHVVFGDRNKLGNPLSGYYLYFSYFSQYKLGFTSYLFQPFLTMYSSYMKRYSDNTLVSVPFLIDNLIKFHPFAFSSYNLELLPELLATSSTPITRPFLDQLLVFLGQNHIRRTDSGLFEYKFYDRTHNEITFISKWFEDEAAAFNFTLDETYSVKAHLQQKIISLRSAHATRYHSQNPIVSIVFLNRLLGDAMFQDEEYQDAIVSYQDALQIIDRERLVHPNTFVSYVSVKLKLGLTYEKIKAYEFAMGHYASVIADAKKFLQKYKEEGDSGVYRDLLMLVMQAFLATIYIQDKLTEEITFQKTKENIHNFLQLIDLFRHDYLTRDIILASYFSGVGTAHYFKNMVLPQYIKLKIEDSEDPIADTDTCKAILQCFPTKRENIAQKEPQFSLNKLTPDFVKTSWKDLHAFNKPSLIHSDARVSFSTFLYYKYSLKILLGCDKEDLASMLAFSGKVIIRTNSSGTYNYYSQHNVKHLRAIGHAIGNMGDFLLPLMVSKEIDVIRAIECFYPKSGDSQEPIDEAKKRLLDGYLRDENKIREDLENNNDPQKGPHPRLIINIFYLSAIFYLEAGDRASAVFELRKIIYVLRSVQLIFTNHAGDSSKTQKQAIYEALSELEKNLLKRILELTSLMSHSSDRPQLIKYKSYFSINTLRTPLDYSAPLYNSLSNNPDNRETIIAFAQLKEHYFTFSIPAGSNLESVFKSIPEHTLLTPLNNVSHQVTRLMELELHTKINYSILSDYVNHRLILASGTRDFFKEWQETNYHESKQYDISNPEATGKITEFCTELKTSFGKDENKKLFSEYVDVVCNSIFNLVMMKRIIYTYGNNYSLSYSYLADIHRYLGFWLKHYHLCRIMEKLIQSPGEDAPRISQKLMKLIGNQTIASLDTLSEYQQALDNYYLALQMHKEGTVYRNNMKNMIYLEDDYNDSLYHFGAALERGKINSGKIRKYVIDLKKELETASRFKYRTFIGSQK